MDVRKYSTRSAGEGWQVYIIKLDNYRMTIATVLAAIIIYAIYLITAQRKKQKTQS